MRARKRGQPHAVEGAHQARSGEHQNRQGADAAHGTRAVVQRTTSNYGASWRAPPGPAPREREPRVWPVGARPRGALGRLHCLKVAAQQQQDLGPGRGARQCGDVIKVWWQLNSGVSHGGARCSRASTREGGARAAQGSALALEGACHWLHAPAAERKCAHAPPWALSAAPAHASPLSGRPLRAAAPVVKVTKRRCGLLAAVRAAAWGLPQDAQSGGLDPRTHAPVRTSGARPHSPQLLLPPRLGS